MVSFTPLAVALIAAATALAQSAGTPIDCDCTTDTGGPDDAGTFAGCAGRGQIALAAGDDYK
ncbi:hypothetical protein C8035_v012258 [Colletotrichum spinosum]|uniref:Uncharacterized protein n=1 Tax=Colletotrichum spinosum TaxID=1347390 RepID=A0A4R8Q299_9PEZI|nr:hypothetical protein C8035_v012258 [Colletotrichum spinosum]